MADSQPPVRRALQRCPNCEVRCDVSMFVHAALARCGHCGVRFEVQRSNPPPAAAADPKPARARGGPSGVLDEVHRSTPPPAAAADPKPAPKDDKPFPTLDGFVVHERIGQGGMGEVFRCTRVTANPPFAEKIPPPQRAAVPDYVRRFGREAAAMAQLDHPGIVRLVGRGKTGVHYFIAMELIDGISLRLWAHKNRPTARQLARLLAQVAHALAYAHARAVVHRDLKPDNVLVTPDLRTKVLDFGLAGLHAEGAQC